jgi:hypothetical protein
LSWLVALLLIWSHFFSGGVQVPSNDLRLLPASTHAASVHRRNSVEEVEWVKAFSAILLQHGLHSM